MDIGTKLLETDYNLMPYTELNQHGECWFGFSFLLKLPVNNDTILSKQIFILGMAIGGCMFCQLSWV